MGKNDEPMSATPASTAKLTAATARDRWTEFLFGLSVFFGVLHLIGVVCDITGQYAVAALGRPFQFSVQSSMLMGNIYLAALGAYVGQKEFQRWRNSLTGEALTAAMQKKISRGEVIIGIWSLVAGITVFLKQMELVAQVPEPLLYTLGEIFVIYFGTGISKYAKGIRTVQTKEINSYIDNFGEQAVSLAKSNGSIDNETCQKTFNISRGQAYRLLAQMTKQGHL
jgi:xanthosine utilization system XapX-like protein